jgi:hypothetical protein
MKQDTEPRKKGIDFTTMLFDHRGKAIPDVMEENAPLSLGAAARHALCMMYPDEQNLSGEEKFKRAKLAFEICDQTNAVLKSQDVTLVKQLIGKFYAPTVVYAAYPLLDNAEG